MRRVVLKVTDWELACIQARGPFWKEADVSSYQIDPDMVG